MTTKEIINRLENVIDTQINNSQKIEIDEVTEELVAKDVFYLGIQFIINIVKNPFELVSKYLKEEIIPSLKKDAGLYMLIMSIIVALFVFFFVVWLFISAAVGIYFYEEGSTLFISIIYSIIFQVISSLLGVLLIYIAFKNLKSLKVLKELKKYSVK